MPWVSKVFSSYPLVSPLVVSANSLKELDTDLSSYILHPIELLARGTVALASPCVSRRISVECGAKDLAVSPQDVIEQHSQFGRYLSKSFLHREDAASLKLLNRTC